MEKLALKAAILIISDTAFQDPSTDKSAQILTDAFSKEGGDQWSISDRTIVPDDVIAVQREICRLSDGDDAVNLLITTGGTGFAVKDNTPEAVHPLLHRHAPGLVHGMLAASLEVTSFAMMSRPVAGVRNKTLIVTLPGSPKGAKENLLAILKLLPHACQQAAGGDSRALHAGGIRKLERDAGVTNKQPSQHAHHHHQHDHVHSHGGHVIPKAHTRPEDRPVSNDPQAGPSNRHRKSPYPIHSVNSALNLIYKNTPPPEASVVAVNTDLVGHTLAEDVTAGEAVPAFRASIVDGYAVIVSADAPSTPGVFSVASVSHAAAGEIPELQRGEVARITTGAPLPPGANAVIMVEDTLVKSTTADGKDETMVEILTGAVKPNENLREVGSDVNKGDVVLRRGEEITSVGGELGLLASVGVSRVSAYRKPIVGVLSTGDEIVSHDREEPLRLGEVRDSNRLTLMAAVRGWGYTAVDLGIAKDRSGSLEEHLRSALRSIDVIITSGGVSMGELDLLKPTIERAIGGTIHFGRVAMKPGKPTTFATVAHKPLSGDRNSARDRLIFSLPGNPASALVTANLFVLPTLQKMSGKPAPWGLPRMKVVLREDVRCDKDRAEYHRVGLKAGDDGRVWASTTGGQRSSKVSSLKGAQGLLCLPAKDGMIARGETIDALLMGSLQGL
ncbi:uncharacterized protein KY384_007669 [Bacidia gigantensis]|uniref:uncharacterized protein n=1 Tax=Bacidia gigantensis TaxID=2732470 RepID=UPI001D0432E5|nr:uncharacterized protein KY384_007669 [Bacidia gigantensis]KAG8527517.1 hypothetical protein KY384_007669 [Bacidia gigantensis]